MYINNLKFLALFSNASLVTEGTTFSSIVPYGEDTFIELLPNDNGYIMKDDQYLVGSGNYGSGYTTSISSEFTMGFWFYSVYPGLAKNPSDNSPESISMPLVDFVGTGSIVESIITVREHSNFDGKNYLSLTLDGGSYYVTNESSPYSPSLWHYVWIYYDGSSVEIYIDGKIQTLTTSDTVPSSLQGGIMEVYINHEQNGYAYNVAKNIGYIDDIFLLNEANNSVSDMQRAINIGIKYVVDDVYKNYDIDSSVIFMNDPNMITVTSAVDDMTYIYVGSNNGKILRGSPLLWEVRKTYSESGEETLINLPEGNQINKNSGFLELKNGMMRL